MATIRELRTKFEGTAKGLKSTIQGVRKDLSSIGTESEKATKKANRSFDEFEKNINKVDTSLKKLDKMDGFKRLQSSIKNARNEVQKYGKISETTLKSLQKNIAASEARFDRMGDSQRENFRDVEAAINETKRELNTLAAEGVISMKVLGAAANDAADEIDDIGNNNGFGDLTDDVADLNGELGDTKVRLKDTNQELEGTESGMDKLRGVVLDTNIVVRALRMSLVALVPAAVPVFATLTTSAMGFVSSLGAGVAGLGGFAAVAIPTLTTVFEATDELQKAQEKYNEAATDEERDKALEELNQIYAGLTEGQLKAVKALQEFKDNFADFRKQYDDPVANIFAKSLETVMNLLQMFSPVIDSTIEGINNLMSGFDRSLQTKDIESFFGFLSSRAGPSIEAFGQSFGYVLRGIFNLMTAFSQQGQSMEQGLLNLSKRFSEWTSNLQYTKGFQEFLDYSATTAPLVLGLFSNLWDILVNVSKLLAPVGQGMLIVLNYATAGISKLTEFANNVKNVLASLLSDNKAEGASILAQMGFDDKTIQMFIRAAQLIEININRIRTAIASMFSDDKGAAKDLLQQLGFNETAINSILYMADLIRSAVKRIPEAFSFMVDAAKGYINGFMRVFDVVYPYIQPLLNDVVTFIGNIVGQIVSFWQSDGQQIMDAVKNAFDFIVGVIKFAMPLVMAIINTVWGSIKNIIQGAVNVIKGIIQVFTGIFTGDFKKMWEGIKNIFFGAIELIWGWINLTFIGRILKGVKLLFTGFKTAALAGWAAIKNLFSGNLGAIIGNLRTAWTTAWNATKTAFTSIWNFLKATFNTLKALFTGTFNFFKTVLTTSWNAIWNTTKTVFNGIWNFLKGIFNFLRNTFNTAFNAYFRLVTTIWTRIWNTTKTVFNGIWNFLKGIFNFLKTTFTTAFNTYFRLVNTIWNRIWSVTKSVFQSVWNFLKGIFNTVRDFISGRVSSIYNSVKGAWDNIYNRTKSIFKNVYNTVKDWFNKIVDRAKELPGKIGDGIKNMASKVKSGITSVINTMASILGKGINGVIGGVNWVLGKIGVDSKVPEWEVPQYKRGTKPGGHPGGPAIVGDGGKQELIETPDGRSFLSPDTDTLVNMPKGTKVYSGNVTEDIMGMFPAYKFGDKLRSAKDWVGDKVGSATSAAKRGASWVWDKTKQVAGKAKDIALDVWDYASNPSKLLDKALDLLGVKKPSFDGILGNMVSGFWNKIKSGASSFIKGKFDDFGSFDSSAPGNVKGWISAAISRTGVPTSWLGPLTTIAMKESGGRTGPSTINNWDINAKRGTPSMGLMQTIRPTFDAFKVDGWNNIMNPIHNAAAAINYIKSRYGNVYNVPGIKALREGRKYVGYADGGIVDTAQLAWIAEGGWAESIISHDPAKRPSQRAIWEQTGRELGFFQGGQNNQEIIDLLLRIANATEGERAILLNDEKLGEFVKDTIDQANGENYAVSKFKL
ncbi:transglycosylase SLT domain-containing protein [Terribacillus sp. JSM ZJ617]|uniref:transglycosylase SLT domain-containing protein n=1 Tax=Terribacillus sp. JSM ZJ617 TaxID=3342119 RepID=UPI0035A8FFBE